MLRLDSVIESGIELMMGSASAVFVSKSAVSLPAIPEWLGTHSRITVVGEVLGV